jgi:preprotein translocase subunit SecY
MIKINKDLQFKILIVLLGIALFRLGSHIPVPGVDPYALNLMFKNYQGTVLDMFNTFSGGSLKRMSIFSIGIMPYISASIIMFLAGFFIPQIKMLKESGLNGQVSINKYTRYLTILIAFFQALGLTSKLMAETVNGLPIVPVSGFIFQLTAILTLMAGTMAVVWICEKITEFGIGNGTSIIIYTSIVSGFPQALTGTIELRNTEQIQNITLFIIGAIVLAAIFFVVVVEKGQKRIKIVNSKNKNQNLHKVSDYLPFKINMAGVMPPVLASTLIVLPTTIGSWIALTDNDILNSLGRFLGHGSLGYLIIFSLMIFFFAYFFNKLQNNPKDISKQLKDNGVFIEGFRPGQQTEVVLSRVMNRLTVIGSTYLLIVCLLPEFLVYYWNVPFYFGGTSLLIIVTVALEWQNQITSQLKNVEYTNIEEELKDSLK